MRVWKIVLASLLILSVGAMAAPAQQIPLPGNAIPQFVDPLPLLDAQTGTADDGIETLTSGTDTITMQEFKSLVLPANTVLNYSGTWVWGYRATAPGAAAQDTYIGPVFVVPRGIPSNIKWVNNLPEDISTSQVLFWQTATDQTLHWADPAGLGMPPVGFQCLPGSIDPLCANYFGPVPAVVHLHGGEVPPQLDGGPDAWYLSTPTVNAAYEQKGHAYYSAAGAGENEAIYKYPNTQEAAPAWFHDHVLGITRLNVYAGLAGGYIITDNDGNPPPADLNDPTKIIPLAIQDRMFDTNGQLFFPNVGINPEHPFWVPEFVGDTILVNGKTWPYIEIEPAKYRFLFLNGSNARAYQMDFRVQGRGTSPTFWVISTDGGYLDNPVPVTQLTMMPGERYGVVIDFSAFKPGTTLLLQNSAKTPFPDGAPVNRNTTGRIMEFRVIDPLVTPYTMPTPPQLTFAPATTVNLRPTNAIEKLTLNITGKPVRRLTLNEVMGPGGPLEVLVNNTVWSGKSSRTYNDFTEVTNSDGSVTKYSELPKEGATEVWEVINLTADAHPIHLHLVQFQLLDRTPFNLRKYTAIYDGSFPGGTINGVTYPAGVFMPAFGPPLNYATGGPSPGGDPANCSDAGAICGGNPAVPANLKGAPVLALPQERGWKDTVIMYPGQVTRIVVRWAPTDLPANTTPTEAYFPFDPNGGHGYVWHCHIIDHEDNEMMRPDYVQSLSVTRTFVQGIDY